jgi:hypothetical protein
MKIAIVDFRQNQCQVMSLTIEISNGFRALSMHRSCFFEFTHAKTTVEVLKEKLSNSQKATIATSRPETAPKPSTCFLIISKHLNL